MKFLLIIIIHSFTFSAFGQYIPSYIESSQGLNIPDMEEGRTEIEFADVNNDGNLDIICVGDHGSPFFNSTEHGVMVWLGDGAGNWSSFQFGNFGYGGVAVGDVNNDGLMDVGYGIHHNYSGVDLGDQLIEVALGDGTGTFWSPWDDGLATNGETWGMFCTDFADVDNDGDLDIGANSFGGGAGVHIYANNLDGTWEQIYGFLGGNSTDDFVFGDVNNDGYPDFAAAHQYGTIYLNDNTGSFIQSDGNLPSGSSIGRRGPDLGDVDNDGTDELSYINSNGGIEVWKWNDGNNWISVSNGLPTSGAFTFTQLFDMNMDGFLDLTAFADALVVMWLGDGTDNWTEVVQINIPASPADANAFRIGGDIDRNGFPDIGLVDEESGFPFYRNHVRIYKESSPADSLSITSLYPGSSRRWNVNSIQTIKWISEVQSGDSSWVKLEISLNDTLGPWQLITSGLPNNGHHQIVVPGWMASQQSCRIRYIVYTQSDSAASITPEGFFIIGDPVDVEKDSEQLPGNFFLFQNYPNPFNPNTKIKYRIPLSPPLLKGESEAGGFVSLKIYDVLGNEIATLVNEEKPAGSYEIEFSAKDLPSGIYFYQLKADSFVDTKKMLLLK